MADLLKSIGIGSGTVDPAALINQKAVDQQVKTIKGQITSLANTIDLAAKSGKLLGVPEAYTNKLIALKDKANGYVQSTKLNPTELYNKMKALDEDYKGLIAVQDKTIDSKRLESARSTVTTVRKRVVEIEGDSTTSPKLREKYQALLLDAENMLTKLEVGLAAAREAQGAIAAAALKEGFQSAQQLLGAEATGQTGDPESILTALFPKVPMSASFFQTSSTTILDRLRILDLEKEEEEQKVFSPVRALKRWAIQVKRIFWFAFLCVGGLIGGIILSNFYFDEPFWAIKIFYFLVGVVAFPFVFLLGLIAPPYWHSILIPLVEFVGTEGVQTGGGDEVEMRAPEAAVVVQQPSIGWFQSLYSYEPVREGAIGLRLNSTKTPMRFVSGLGLLATGGMMYWNDFFKYLTNGEA
jgi:hypothetical protein